MARQEIEAEITIRTSHRDSSQIEYRSAIALEGIFDELTRIRALLEENATRDHEPAPSAPK